MAGPNDEALLARLFSAPAFFGEADVLSDIPWMETVVTAVDSRIIFIPKTAFEEMLLASPAFTAALLRDVSKRLMLTSELGRQLAFGDVGSRVARYLLDYAENLGPPAGNGIQIAADLSQRVIAEELALSRRVVQETMTEMARARIVDKEGRRVVVVRHRIKLRMLAGIVRHQAVGHRHRPDFTVSPRDSRSLRRAATDRGNSPIPPRPRNPTFLRSTLHARSDRTTPRWPDAVRIDAGASPPLKR